MCEKYSTLEEEDKYEIASASHLGGNNYIMCKYDTKATAKVSQSTQLDLKTMTYLSLENCILIEDTSPGTIEFKME